MHLEWNPIGKPKPGKEQEFAQLFEKLSADNLTEAEQDKLLDRFEKVQITPYETLGAPQVGRDKPANEWLRKHYQTLPEPKPSLQEYTQEMQGYDVIEMVPLNDGLPFYSNYRGNRDEADDDQGNSFSERFSFNAGLLELHCADFTGDALLDRCYLSCLASDLAALGKDLRAAADQFAAANNAQSVASARECHAANDTAVKRAHIAYSAARWCEYWSSRGHGIEAYF
jgi:hypothetical protein